MSVTVQTEKEAFWYLNLTPAQQTAYEQLHAHLKATDSLAEGRDDQWTLLRFLKARQWDVTKATVMYTDMVRWRAKESTDALFDTLQYPEYDALMQVYPHFYHKTDRFGRPLYIELVGKTNPNKMVEVSNVDAIMRYHIWSWERCEKEFLPACTAASGKPIITATVIIDLLGLSLKNFTLTAQKVVKLIAHVDQDYYPERLGQMFIINAPIIFRAVWAMVNPLLEERTRRKIIIVGYDYMPLLKQVVSEENLPEMFGGRSKVKDHHTSEGPWGTASTPGHVKKADTLATLFAAKAKLDDSTKEVTVVSNSAVA
ncbi:MAG: hypothetical protein WDW38_002051 [Sanguina aurantia]